MASDFHKRDRYATGEAYLRCICCVAAAFCTGREPERSGSSK